MLLPELMPGGYTLTPEIWNTAEPFDGATTRWLRELGKQFGLYVGTTFLEADGDDFYNTFVHSRRRIVIPDLAGHGESTQDLSLDYGIEQQAIRLHEFLNALGIEKVHLIANSMGCAIALRFAATNPQAISSLVLMDAAGVERTAGRLQTQIVETGRNPIVEIRTVEDYRSMLRFGMESPPWIPGIFVNLLAEEKIKRRNIEMKMLGDIEKYLDQIAILGNIKAPTLIIWGAQDRVVHVDDAELLHERIAGSKKLILAGIGHVPMVENPRLVATPCVSFLNELAA